MTQEQSTQLVRKIKNKEKELSLVLIITILIVSGIIMTGLL
jgi:hypothetical protein